VKTKNIRVFVIAVDCIPRNSKLVSSLIKVFPKHNIYVLDAVQPKDIESTTIKQLMKQNNLMLGRKVTPQEIAVTLSHNQCYKIANHFEWQDIFILEDDVFIEDHESLLKLINSLNETKKPLIRTFYSPRWGIWKMTNGVFKSIIPPAYAAAYMINSSAVKIALAKGTIGLADWPIWSSKVQFHFLDNKVIELLDVKSFLEKDREELKQVKRDYKQILNPKFIIKINIFLRIRHYIVLPTIWKIFKYWECYKSANTNKPDSSIFLK
jgi:hypothetical protein